MSWLYRCSLVPRNWEAQMAPCFVTPLYRCGCETQKASEACGGWPEWVVGPGCSLSLQGPHAQRCRLYPEPRRHERASAIPNVDVVCCGKIVTIRCLEKGVPFPSLHRGTLWIYRWPHVEDGFMPRHCGDPRRCDQGNLGVENCGVAGGGMGRAEPLMAPLSPLPTPQARGGEGRPSTLIVSPIRLVLIDICG